LRRLSETLLPVWRYAGVTRPLGGAARGRHHLQGSGPTATASIISDVDGDRPDVGEPGNDLGRAARRFDPPSSAGSHDFSKARKVQSPDVFARCRLTVHGMPQIRQLRKACGSPAASRQG